MSTLRAIGERQEQQLEDFRQSEQAKLMLRLAQTECLLGLAKLATNGVDMGSYVSAAMGVLEQFVSTRGCSVAVDITGLPPLFTFRGEDPAGLDGAVRSPLQSGDDIIGEVAIAVENPDLGPPEFVESVAERLTAGITAITESERLRRQVALAETNRLVGELSDQPGAEDFRKLVEALASLPNVLGARVDVSHSAIGGSMSLSCGLPPVDDPIRGDIPGGRLSVAIRWAVTAQDPDRRLVADLVATMGEALAKAEDSRRLRAEIETDPLTGVGNRRRAMSALTGAIRLAELTDDYVGVVYLDLDNFKQVNDRFGHDVGDRILTSFAGQMAKMVRSSDTVARLGGEEFVIICPGLDESGGMRLCERILAAIPGACESPESPGWKQTASAGLAVFPTDADHPDGVLRAADQALLYAKRSGRNQAKAAPAPR
jgi:diguanylate cyclase (GGDEF)-like protein